jgi:hypothetical protein
MPDDTSAAEACYHAMRRYFPERAIEKPSRSLATGEVSDSDFDNEDYVEFILSTNWILRPRGLEEFYKRLQELIKVHGVSID